MTRADYFWVGLRGTALFFLAQAILLVPSAVHAMRVRDLVLGPDAAERLGEFTPVAFGITGVLTSIGIYALAAATLLLVPVRRELPGG
ncbi:MAG: hypothetical protein ACYTGP_06185 [Planctomycetota bacterium]|jgi:hypothetical protein